MRSGTLTIIKGRSAGQYVRGLIVALALVVAGCETAPVQEMSDARQAIAVARDAGAAEHAASELRAAETYLQSAEQKLEQRAFAAARADALAAKNRALQALSVADKAKQEKRD